MRMKWSLILILLGMLSNSCWADPPVLTLTIEVTHHDPHGRLVIELSHPCFLVVIKNVSDQPYRQPVYGAMSFELRSSRGKIYPIRSVLLFQKQKLTLATR